jgi:hypothetical protein
MTNRAQSSAVGYWNFPSPRLGLRLDQLMGFNPSGGKRALIPTPLKYFQADSTHEAVRCP